MFPPVLAITNSGMLAHSRISCNVGPLYFKLKAIGSGILGLTESWEEAALSSFRISGLLVLETVKQPGRFQRRRRWFGAFVHLVGL